MPKLDLLVKNTRIWGPHGLQEGTYDLGIADGRFVEIAPTVTAEATQIIDAEQRLVVPGFVEPHIHLDKALINEEVRANRSGTLAEAIEIIWEKKARYTVEDIVRRASRVVEMAVCKGTTYIRTHVDVDSIGGLLPLEGVLAVREQYKDIVDIQIVAFPQEGILKDPGTDMLLARAMEMGADVVGGMPFNEHSQTESKKHIEIAFEIARAFQADIDMHVDETDDPEARTLEMLADQTIAYHYTERVTAGHTCALAAYPDAYARAVIQKVKQARMHMITNPATNLMLQGRQDQQPIRRGITRVKELLAEGINVAFGQDCVKDTFYPFGQADMLEVALITAHAAHMSQPEEIETVLAMPTYNAAKILRLKEYGIVVGYPADLVVIDAQTAAEAIRLQPDRRYVIKRGRIVAETVTQQKAYW